MDRTWTSPRLAKISSASSPCSSWLKWGAKELEQVNPEVEDGLSLSTVRARIKKLKNMMETLP